MQKAGVTKLTEDLSTLTMSGLVGCPSWLQFKLLIDLTVHKTLCIFFLDNFVDSEYIYMRRGPSMEVTKSLL